jgi:hypothetical protein
MKKDDAITLATIQALNMFPRQNATELNTEYITQSCLHIGAFLITKLEANGVKFE